MFESILSIFAFQLTEVSPTPFSKMLSFIILSIFIVLKTNKKLTLPTYLLFVLWRLLVVADSMRWVLDKLPRVLIILMV